MKHMRRSRITFFCIVTLIAGTVICMLLPRKDQEKEILHVSTITPQYTFLEDGILYYNNYRISYVDSNSISNAILCDKPNCIHEPASSRNPNPTCNAVVLSAIGSGLNIKEDKLFFLDGQDINRKTLYQSELNGGNRKEIASLDIMMSQYAASVAYIDDYFIYGYKNDDKFEQDLLVRLEKPKVGLFIVDLKNKNVYQTAEKEGYEGQILNIHSYGGILYYVYFSADTKIDYNNFDVAREENQELLKKNNTIRIYGYNINTGEESLVYEGKYVTIGGFQEDQVYLIHTEEGKDQLYQIDLNTGDKQFLFEEIDMINVFVDGDNIIYSTIETKENMEQIFTYKYYKLKNKEIHIIKEVEDSRYYIIQAIVGNKLYVTYNDHNKNEYAVGCMNRDDFYAGDLEKVQALLYPNTY